MLYIYDDGTILESNDWHLLYKAHKKIKLTGWQKLAIHEYLTEDDKLNKQGRRILASPCQRVYQHRSKEEIYDEWCAALDEWEQEKVIKNQFAAFQAAQEMRVA